MIRKFTSILHLRYIIDNTIAYPGHKEKESKVVKATLSSHNQQRNEIRHPLLIIPYMHVDVATRIYNKVLGITWELVSIYHSNKRKQGLGRAKNQHKKSLCVTLAADDGEYERGNYKAIPVAMISGYNVNVKSWRRKML